MKYHCFSCGKFQDCEFKLEDGQYMKDFYEKFRKAKCNSYFVIDYSNIVLPVSTLCGDFFKQ